MLFNKNAQTIMDKPVKWLIIFKNNKDQVVEAWSRSEAIRNSNDPKEVISCSLYAFKKG